MAAARRLAWDVKRHYCFAGEGTALKPIPWIALVAVLGCGCASTREIPMRSELVGAAVEITFEEAQLIEFRDVRSDALNSLSVSRLAGRVIDSNSDTLRIRVTSATPAAPGGEGAIATVPRAAAAIKVISTDPGRVERWVLGTAAAVAVLVTTLWILVETGTN